MRTLSNSSFFCDDWAKDLTDLDFADPDEGLIRRDYGYRREIGLARMLAAHMEDFYNTPLRGCVAIIVSVVTGKTVTKDQVRDWYALVSG